MLIILFTLSVLAYGQALFFDIINYDDPYHLGKDFIVDGFQFSDLVLLFRETGTNLWHPLTWASFYLDHYVGGTFISHAINVVLHAANVSLLFLLLSKFSLTRNIAVWVALVHLIHPLHIESVAWISARKDVLSLFFGLLSILLFQLAVKGREIDKRFIGLSLLGFLLALMSKPIVVVVPLVLLVVYQLQCRKDSLRVKAGLGAVFVLPAVLFSLMTLLIHSISDNAKLEVQSTMFAKFVLICQNYTHYLGQFFYPTKLSFFYPIPDKISNGYFISFVIPLLTVMSVVALCRNTRVREFAVYWLLFVVCYLPTCGLINVGDALRADRYMYIPLIVLSVLVLRIFENLFKQRLVFRVLLILWLISLSLSFTRYLPKWNNNESLYSYAIQVDGENYLAWQNLAAANLEGKRYARALENFTKVLALKPNFKRTHLGMAQAHYALANFNLAEFHYKKEVELHPDVDAYLNLGYFLYQRQRYSESMECIDAFDGANKDLDMLYCTNAIKLKLYQKAILKYQSYPVGSLMEQDLKGYGVALYKNGNVEQAEKIFQRLKNKD